MGVDPQRHHEQTVCIVLQAGGPGLGEAARRQIADRNWQTLTVTDPIAAMAEAAMRERAQIARGAWGLPRAESVAMLLDETTAPGEATERDMLIRAVNRYLPNVAIWTCSESGLEPLPTAGRTSARTSSGATAVFSKTDDQSDRKPSAELNPGTRRGVSQPEESEPPQEVAITREEIDMLLETTGERKL